MEHSHIIIDKDNHFIIDPVTRKIKPETHEKNKLVEGDHKSERYTFELPKTIEGHDMSECNVVEIHYLNASADKKNKVEDIYDVDDLGVLESKPDTLAFTWLIKEPATRYSGLLSFAIVFKCTTGDIIDYAWHTEIYSNVSIAKSMNNSAAIIEEYSDILAQWKEELFGVEGKIQTALSDSLIAIENESTKTLESISTKSTEALNNIDKTAKDTTAALEQKSQEVVEAIEDYGVVQVSEEEPTNPNVDLYINPNEKVTISVPEIDDENVSLEDTWSSHKISEELKQNSNNKLDKQQGAENKGKALVVGDDGNVVIGEVQGGVGETWRVIKEFTIPQDISSEFTDIKYLVTDDGRITQFGINSDLENKPISLKKVFLYIKKETPFCDSEILSNVLFRYNTFTGNYNLLQFYRYITQSTRILIGEIEKIGRYIKATASTFRTTPNYSWSSNIDKNVYVYNNIPENENITELSVNIPENTSVKSDFRGATVTILGVDA